MTPGPLAAPVHYWAERWVEIVLLKRSAQAELGILVSYTVFQAANI